MINNKNGNTSFFCSNCGAELKEEDIICSQCGADVIEIEDDDTEISPLFGEEEVEIRCSNCGEILKPGVIACSSCGTLVDEELEDDTSETVLLKTYNSTFEADMAKALLEAHGIDSFISIDNEGGMLPALNQRGIKLIVMAEDFEKAVEILSSSGDMEE